MEKIDIVLITVEILQKTASLGTARIIRTMLDMNEALDLKALGSCVESKQ